MRRMKYKIEQECIGKAESLLFEEHAVFSKAELQIDLQNSYEELIGKNIYYFLSLSFH